MYNAIHSGEPQTPAPPEGGAGSACSETYVRPHLRTCRRENGNDKVDIAKLFFPAAGDQISQWRAFLRR